MSFESSGTHCMHTYTYACISLPTGRYPAPVSLIPSYSTTSPTTAYPATCLQTVLICLCTTIMGSGFNVWSAAGRALLYAFTSQYHSYPTHKPLIPHSYCTHTQLILHSYCAHTPLILHSYPTNAVLILHPYSIHTQRTLILHSYSEDSPCLSSVKECAQG